MMIFAVLVVVIAFLILLYMYLPEFPSVKPSNIFNGKGTSGKAVVGVIVFV
jgi:hypothetical protein